MKKKVFNIVFIGVMVLCLNACKSSDKVMPVSQDNVEETMGGGSDVDTGQGEEDVVVGNTVPSDFFESARLSKEQTRAKNKEILMEIVENPNTNEKQKESAINEIVSITSIAEKENASENLLAAKGFNNVVVSIVEGNVDVIVDASNLSEQQIAQIEDIVKRKTGISSENIVISPVEKKE